MRTGLRSFAVLLLVLVVALGLGAPGAHAAKKKKRKVVVPATAHVMPFVCGTSWTGSTRGSHSPDKNAIDFNAPSDLGKPVVASAPGRVSKADNASTTGYGRHVVVDHGNGETTVYAHLKRALVTKGVTVDQGTVLGEVGSTGKSTGAHLHYEQKVGKTVAQVWFARAKYRLGTAVSTNCADVPLAGDLLEGGGDELVVFRRASAGEFHVRRADGTATKMVLGAGVDDPLVGDWDGDGLVDPGVWSARTKKFTLAGEAGTIVLSMGTRGDRAVSGDWDGDGRWEVGVRRPSSSSFRLRAADGTVSVVKLGNTDDVPVTGDWDGDGVTDLGVYDPATSTFTLRTVTATGEVLTTLRHGTAGDLPVVGDWDGDGVSDLGVWRPSNATFHQRLVETTGAARVNAVRFGRAR